MARVRGKNTKPEIAVRRVFHKLGFRFRLHRADLPGRPDIVLPRHRVAIFVHGCFWHRHAGCSKASTPKTRVEFWNDKFATNIVRDRKNVEALQASDWTVMVIWECEVRGLDLLAEKLASCLCRGEVQYGDKSVV